MWKCYGSRERLATIEPVNGGKAFEENAEIIWAHLLHVRICGRFAWETGRVV